MYWANFLHIYQPPVQTLDILLKVADESYRKLFDGLLDHPEAKMTVNINGILTEMLAENGCGDIIERMKTLMARDQLELTGSAMYHPLLPKLPESQIIRQIELNTKTNQKYFGKLYQPKGFFPPEMGFDHKVGAIVKKLDYTWIILDEYSSPVRPNPTKTFVDKAGLQYFFRERDASVTIAAADLDSPQGILKKLGARFDRPEYMVTAMDGEMFGHHRPGLDQLLSELYHVPQLTTVLLSDLRTLFPNTVTIKPLEATWALTLKDRAKDNPFSRWADPNNHIHQKQWELTHLVLKLLEAEPADAQRLVDYALYSDQYWWASAKPWWSLEMIERGAYELLSAVQKFKHASVKNKKFAEELYIEIITTGFAWQRNGTVAELAQQEVAEITASDKENLHRLYW